MWGETKKQLTKKELLEANLGINHWVTDIQYKNKTTESDDDFSQIIKYHFM